MVRIDTGRNWPAAGNVAKRDTTMMSDIHRVLAAGLFSAIVALTPPLVVQSAMAEEGLRIAVGGGPGGTAAETLAGGSADAAC